MRIDLHLVSWEDNSDRPRFIPRWSRNAKNEEIYQLILWWYCNCCQAGERSEITPAAFSIRCGERSANKC